MGSYVNWVWGLQAAKVFLFHEPCTDILKCASTEICVLFSYLKAVFTFFICDSGKEGIVVICNHFHEQASYQYPVFTGQSLFPGRTLGIMQISAEHHQTKPRGLFHDRKVKSHQHRVVIFHHCVHVFNTISWIKLHL